MENNIVLNEFDLNQEITNIIKKRIKRNDSFYELSSNEKYDIINYINKYRKDLKIFHNKGFDILKKCFFAEEYKIDKDEGDFYLSIVYFDMFSDYYEYVLGDIYNHSCYYGYIFSENEINKYNIDFNKIEMNSYIKEKHYDYSFEKLTKERFDNYEINNKKYVKWITNIKQIRKSEDIYDLYQKYCKKYDSYSYKNYFFSFIYNDTKWFKKAAIEYVCLYDIYSGITFEDILFNFGLESAMEVINNFRAGYSEQTRKKRKKDMFEKLKSYQNNEYTLKREISYDESQCVFYIYDNYVSGISSVMNYTKAFLSFNDLKKFLNNDLTNCKLRNAPISEQELDKNIYNSTTSFPEFHYNEYVIEKKYYDKQFIVCQKWMNSVGEVILENKRSFDYFCDFIYFLDNDLSNADLIMLDGLENIMEDSINFTNSKTRSEVAEHLKLKINEHNINPEMLVEFSKTDKNELETLDNYLEKRDITNEQFELTKKFSYISDIHLIHKIIKNKCKSFYDIEYVLKTIIENINDTTEQNLLICGDICSDFNLYSRFVNELNKNNKKIIFTTLGNHELWAFEGKDLPYIINQYDNELRKNNINLVHNNIYYYSFRRIYKISTETLEQLSEEELRNRLRLAEVIIFGGIGFSGYNKEFNADSGIYKNVLLREQEIIESQKFEILYSKVSKALSDKNVIILTHMPLKDWSKENEVNGFVYVNGHNHKNYFFDDKKTRVYSDNQIGYDLKEVKAKTLSINYDYDFFSDYKDGIYDIRREEYIVFYRGKGQIVNFNRELSIKMIKKMNYYLFLAHSKKGDVYILNGGAIKKLDNNDINYYYDNIENVIEKLLNPLSKYTMLQKKISDEIISIGGDGTIHGSIIDIDFYNHIYLNPFDLSLTPYFAYSIIDKTVYSSVSHLLEDNCPQLYRRLLDNKKENIKKYEILKKKNNDKIMFDENTDIYRASREIKKMQKLYSNILTVWPIIEIKKEKKKIA